MLDKNQFINMFLNMNEDIHKIIGLGFLVLIALFLGLYVAWKTRGKTIRRAAKEDLKLVRGRKMSMAELARKIQDMVPSLLTANSVLAAIMVAAVFIIVSQVFFKSDSEILEGLTGVILIVALALAAIAAVMWLWVIEQLTQIIAPSAKPKSIIRFHILNYDLWFYSLILILIDIYLFLLLVNLIAAIITGFVTCLVLLKYWKIQQEW